jgi:hypothetical protein
LTFDSFKVGRDTNKGKGFTLFLFFFFFQSLFCFDDSNMGQKWKSNLSFGGLASWRLLDGFIYSHF